MCMGNLQDFSSICEVSDVTKSKYGHDLLPRDHWVQIASTLNIVSNNLHTAALLPQQPGEEKSDTMREF